MTRGERYKEYAHSSRVYDKHGGCMSSDPLSNRLLLSLPPRNLKQLAPNLEFIRCQSQQILLDVDASLDHVLFPNSGVISVVAVYADGQRHRDGDDWPRGLHRSADLFWCQALVRQASGTNSG